MLQGRVGPGGDIAVAGDLENIGTEMMKVRGKKDDYKKNAEGYRQEFFTEGRIRSLINRFTH
jgi:hypothetical protein